MKLLNLKQETVVELSVWKNFSAADFFSFTDYLGFHGINSFGKGFVKIFMVGFAGKLLASVTAINAHMIRFICNFVQFNVKRKFIVSNFYQFFKSLMYVRGNSLSFECF